MAEEKKKGFDIPLQSAGVYALALAVIGLVWSGPVQLIDERPLSHMKAKAEPGRIQDVDARMWQDPLEAVHNQAKQPASEYRLAAEVSGTKLLKAEIQRDDRGGEGHSPEVIFKGLFTDGAPVSSLMQLGALIPGGPFPEEEERRRRSRYAVLSALATQGFVPEDPEHIGYFAVSEFEYPNLPKVVPFEMFGKESGTIVDGQPAKDRVIIFWLDDTKFSNTSRYVKGGARYNVDIDQSLHTLFSLATPARGERQPAIFRAVIGPNKSNMLRTLLDESKVSRDSLSANGIYYFASGATVDHALITKNTNDARATPIHPAAHVFRTIGNDSQISQALTAELALRQVGYPRGNVLLISEWDSFYGRSFPQTFARTFTGSQNAGCFPMAAEKANSSATGDVAGVYCTNYMRGIDGLLPGDANKQDSAQEGKTGSSETIRVNNNIDRPAGNYQRDYLRRLVENVRQLDNELRKRTLPNPLLNNGIAAIGVVGSDVYDKLMILQALRPYFPGKLFFTTDLDAAYFVERELPFTRNLIVGSSFGLSLNPELQKNIPPFRDSYQTSTFFSSLLAMAKWRGSEVADQMLENALGHWLRNPRVFEISNKGAYDLSATDDTGAVFSSAFKCAEQVLGCNEVHVAPKSDLGSMGWYYAQLIFLVVISLVMFYRMNWTVRKVFEKFRGTLVKKLERGPYSDGNLNKTLSMRFAPLLLYLLVVSSVAGIVALMIFSSVEPFSVVGGVSIWPSNLMQLTALIWAVLAIIQLKATLQKADKRIGSAFTGTPSAEHLLTTEERGWASNLWGVYHWGPRSATENKVNVIYHWARYQEFGKPRFRFARAAIVGTLFVLFGLACVMVSGGQPVPSRGLVSFIFDTVVELGCVTAVVLLVMGVVDAQRLSCKLIHLIAEDKVSDWPSMRDTKWGWPAYMAEYMPYWLDVEFVARFTKTMENYIWYPVPPLVLLGMARSRIFDNWTFSPGLLIAILVLLTYLFSVAFIVQYTARVMRRKAVTKLEGKLAELRGALHAEEGRASLLEKMIADIKHNENGAFTPFLHQPLVQALITFVSGSSGFYVMMERFF